MVGNTRV